MDFKAHKQRVHELDAEGTLLERRIADLSKDLASSQDAYAENRRERAARTPLHALPDDILKLILEEAYEHRLHEDCPEARISAISHVSRRLRRLAISLPRLWRCIHSGPEPIAFLKLILSRAGNLPLFVVSDSRGNQSQHGDADPKTDLPEDHALRHAEQLNYLIQGYERRIAYLSIVTQNVYILRSTLPNLSRKTFPLVEFIELDAASNALHADRINYSLPQSPNLETLWLTAVPFSFTSNIYENLTSLTIGDTTLASSDLRDAARACPNLTFLHLDYVGLDGDSGDSNIHFARLESLRLSHVAGPDGYLDWLDAPVLASIVLSSCGVSSHGVSTFDPGALRPFPAIRLLRCTNLEAPHAPFDGSLLQYMPDMTTLELRHCSAGPGSLAAHLADASPAPLPALQKLLFIGLESGSHDVVLRIVRHRIQHEVPLKEVQLGEDVRDAMDAGLLKTLEELVTVTAVASDVDDWDGL